MPSVLPMFLAVLLLLPILDPLMCNLYSQTKSQDAMRHVFDAMTEEDEDFEDLVGNLQPMAGIFPDYGAPIIRHGANGGWQLTKARWGMPMPQVFLAGKRTDPGRDQYPQCGVLALETLAGGSEPLSCALHQLFRD